MGGRQPSPISATGEQQRRHTCRYQAICPVRDPFLIHPDLRGPPDICHWQFSHIPNRQRGPRDVEIAGTHRSRPYFSDRSPHSARCSPDVPGPTRRPSRSRRRREEAQREDEADDQKPAQQVHGPLLPRVSATNTCTDPQYSRHLEGVKARSFALPLRERNPRSATILGD